METTLPLHQMTKEEKLRVMEALWADLSRDESQVESPTWHGDVLQDRAEAVKSGKEAFMDWEIAKKQLRDRQKRLAFIGCFSKRFPYAAYYGTIFTSHSFRTLIRCDSTLGFI
jgi:hypothetical protein